MVFKTYYALWMLHSWNLAHNTCFRYADFSVLIDLKRKKKNQSENYVWKVLISFNNFHLKGAHFTETVVRVISLWLSIK